MKISTLLSTGENVQKLMEYMGIEKMKFHTLKTTMENFSFKNYLLELLVLQHGFSKDLFDELSDEEINTLETVRNSDTENLLQMLITEVKVDSRLRTRFNMVDSIINNPEIKCYFNTIGYKDSKVYLKLPTIHYLMYMSVVPTYVDEQGMVMDATMSLGYSQYNDITEIMEVCKELEETIYVEHMTIEAVISVMEHANGKIKIKQTNPLITDFKVSAPNGGDSFMFSLDQNYRPAYINDVEFERIENKEISIWLKQLANFIYHKS